MGKENWIEERERKREREREREVRAWGLGGITPLNTIDTITLIIAQSTRCLPQLSRGHCKKVFLAQSGPHPKMLIFSVIIRYTLYELPDWLKNYDRALDSYDVMNAFDVGNTSLNLEIFSTHLLSWQLVVYKRCWCKHSSVSLGLL